MKLALKHKDAMWGLICLALALLGLLLFALQGEIFVKIVTLIAAAGTLYLLLTSDLERLWNLPSLTLLGYVLLCMLSALWADAGKFQLREISKVSTAVFFFLLLVLRGGRDRGNLRRAMGLISGTVALYAFFSVESISYGLTTSLLVKYLPQVGYLPHTFGSRMYGVFGNSNIEAAVFAIGVIFALALLCDAEREDRKHRALWAVLLAFNAYALLLTVSLGAFACFAASVVVYLVFSGKGRPAALLRMLEAAVPTVLFAALAFSLYNSESGKIMPLLLLLADAAVVTALELTASARLAVVLERHEKLALGAILAVVALAAVYAGASLLITEPWSGGGTLYRTATLAPGEHSFQIDADAGVRVQIRSQNRAQILTNRFDDLYDATDEPEGSFTVPDNDGLVKFWLYAPEGAAVRAVTIDGGKQLPLKYKLLPGFIADRIQDVALSSSQAQRNVYVEDAIKLWRTSPVFGRGVGVFENSLCMVQDFHYETKYVHNHYAQTLLENGVVGIVLFLGMLGTMFAALWSKRRRTTEDVYYWLYPALFAEMVMITLHMMWDVFMNHSVFVIYVYVLFGLIVVTCAEPLRLRESEQGKVSKEQRRKQKERIGVFRAACLTFCALYTITLAGNLHAKLLMTGDSITINDLALAARVDLYEWRDAALSYAMSLVDAPDPEPFLAQANEYAHRLLKQPSNSVPQQLVRYYLATDQNKEALNSAILSGTWSASDMEVWNSVSAMLNQRLIVDYNSPLLTDPELMPLLEAYYNALIDYGKRALVMPEVSQDCMNFFATVERLIACEGDTEQMANIIDSVNAM